MNMPRNASTVEQSRRRFDPRTVAAVAVVLLLAAAGAVAYHLGYLKINLDTPSASIAGGTSEDFAKALKPISDHLVVIEEKADSAVDTANAAKAIAEANTDAQAELADKMGKMASAVDNFISNANTAFATKAEVAAIDTKLTAYIESQDERWARLQEQYEELKKLVSKPAPAEPEAPVEPVAPVSTVSIADITRSCDGTWLEQFYVGKFDSVEEWLEGASAEYWQDVLNTCPPLMAISPKDPPPVAALPLEPDNPEQWAADLAATCGSKNFSALHAAEMGRHWVTDMLQDCSAMHTGKIGGPIVIPVSNKKPMATGGGCAYVEVYSPKATRVQITAPGHSRIVNIKAGTSRVCVPRSWFELRWVAICLLDVRGNPKRTIDGGWMQTARANLSGGSTANPGNPMFQ